MGFVSVLSYHVALNASGSFDDACVVRLDEGCGEDSGASPEVSHLVSAHVPSSLELGMMLPARFEEW